MRCDHIPNSSHSRSPERRCGWSVMRASCSAAPAWPVRSTTRKTATGHQGPVPERHFVELREEKQDLVFAFVGLASHIWGYLKKNKHKTYKWSYRAWADKSDEQTWMGDETCRENILWVVYGRMEGTEITLIQVKNMVRNQSIMEIWMAIWASVHQLHL